MTSCSLVGGNGHFEERITPTFWVAAYRTARNQYQMSEAHSMTCQYRSANLLWHYFRCFLTCSCPFSIKSVYNAGDKVKHIKLTINWYSSYSKVLLHLFTCMWRGHTALWLSLVAALSSDFIIWCWSVLWWMRQCSCRLCEWQGICWVAKCVNCCRRAELLAEVSISCTCSFILGPTKPFAPQSVPQKMHKHFSPAVWAPFCSSYCLVN